MTDGVDIDDEHDAEGAGRDDASTTHLRGFAGGGDAALLRATGAGSRQAFAALTRRYVAPVYAWSATRSASPDEATRVTAAVFRSVRDEAATAPEDCDVDGWMLDVCQRSAGPLTGDDDTAPSVADLDAVWVGSKVRTALASLPSPLGDALRSPAAATSAASVTDACDALHDALVRTGVRGAVAPSPLPPCRRDAEVGPYLLGAADGAASTAFRRHLESCASCRARCAELDGLAELLDAATLAADPPPGLVEAVLAEVPVSPVPPAPPTRRTRRRAPVPAPPDDFVFGPERPTPRRRAARRAGTVVAFLVAAALGAAALLLVSSVTSSWSGDVPFESLGSGASGTAAFRPNANGTAVVIDVDGLEPGRYDVVVVTQGGTTISAGGFDAAVDGTAKVALQTAATAGLLEVRTGGRPLLRTRIAR